MSEFRAGYVDAMRTNSPGLAEGFRYGDVFYALGFAAGWHRGAAPWAT